MSVSKAQRAKPKSKRYAQRVNKAGDSPSMHAQAYRTKAALWRDLLRGLLVLVPRENRTMYREGLLLVRAGLADQELQSSHTLYLRKSKYCDEQKLIHALYLSTVKATNSPGREDDVREALANSTRVKSTIKIELKRR